MISYVPDKNVLLALLKQDLQAMRQEWHTLDLSCARQFIHNTETAFESLEATTLLSEMVYLTYELRNLCWSAYVGRGKGDVVSATLIGKWDDQLLQNLLKCKGLYHVRKTFKVHVGDYIGYAQARCKVIKIATKAERLNLHLTHPREFRDKVPITLEKKDGTLISAYLSEVLDVFILNT
jgi:hypothetical protein